MLAKTLKRSGFQVFAYREYPSLIKGGYANYQIDISNSSISSSSVGTDVAVCLSRLSIHKVVWDMEENGIIVHWMNKFKFNSDEEDQIKKKNIEVIYIDAKTIVEEAGGIKIMINTFLTGMAWNMLGLEINKLEEGFKEQFGHKEKILKSNLEILKLGFEYDCPSGLITDWKLEPKNGSKDDLMITGNEALALGAIHAGVRAYYAYPMTPSSSILSCFSKTYHKTKILVKQAEDEITAAQMTLGSMHAGTRALVATSGGGFDLMTESLSLAAITEIPFVCVIAQRPGPATGVPTWTADGDLNLAIYAGHGEFVRCVLCVSDASSAFRGIQEAFNIAEKFQIPVLVLTDKQIAESIYQVKKDDLVSINIERGLVQPDGFSQLKSEDRYQLTESGISKRWLPGQSPATYVANSDEHKPNGHLTEESEEVYNMMSKRMRKLDSLLETLPEPELFGQESGKILFVGWGSVKSPVLDAIKDDKEISYLHYEYVHPLKIERLMSLSTDFDKLILIENNYTGQLGQQIKLASGIEFDEKLLKFDGRSFFVEDVQKFIGRILSPSRASG